MQARMRGVLAFAALIVPGRALAGEGSGTSPDADRPAETDAGGAAAPAAAPAGEPAPVTEPAGRAHAAAEQSAPETPRFAWEPFGFLRLQYIAVQNDPNVAFVGRDDGFELQNARVGVRGKLGQRAAFVISLDGAVDERAQVNTPEGKLRVGLRDAYADVALSGSFAARAGFFQTWVDPQALVADTARAFVDRPIESRGMRATEGWQTPSLPPGRSIGAALRLDPALPVDSPKIGLEVAAQNGADEYASNNDNDKPALSAAVLVRLPHDSWLVGAGRWNPRTVGDLPFRQDETDYQGTFGAHLASGPVALEAGLVVQRTVFESTGGPTQDAYGAHGQVMVSVPASLPLAIGYRFGILDPSNLIVTDRVMEHTVGGVLAVPSYRMRVQLQLTHVQEQAARELSNDRIQLAAEVSL